MNRLINFLIRWKLKRGTWIVDLPYFDTDYWVCEHKASNTLEIQVRRRK